MYECVQNTFLEGTFMRAPSFFCVRPSHDLRVRTHVHSLEGTLLVIIHSFILCL